MSTITFKGKPLQTVGLLPTVGSIAPEFTLTKTDLSEINIKELRGYKVILNIFPSLDTGVCAASVKTFDKRQDDIQGIKILCISADLPFAAGRFCEVGKIANIVHASTFRHGDFGEKFGVAIADGPLRGLMSRAVVALDENGRIIYAEQVAEITDEPNYDAAIAAVRNSREKQ